jgi:hypothetical protein
VVALDGWASWLLTALWARRGRVGSGVSFDARSD